MLSDSSIQQIIACQWPPAADADAYIVGQRVFGSENVTEFALLAAWQSSGFATVRVQFDVYLASRGLTVTEQPLPDGGTINVVDITGPRISRFVNIIINAPVDLVCEVYGFGGTSFPA